MRLLVSAIAVVAALGCVYTAMGGTAGAQDAERPPPVPSDPIGVVEILPTPPSPHWVLVTDVLLRRAALVDLDDGEFLGVVSAAHGPVQAAFAADGSEFYLPETFYSRGSRGVRTDVVTIYSTETLAPSGEVVIPSKRAIDNIATGNVALSDDGRFLAVFNLTPSTSLSIVDVATRTFVGEIPTPGCSLVFAAGPRRFLMICGDGAALAVQLDEDGGELSKRRSAPFFDPDADPVTEKAVRWRDQWLFVSFEGGLHAVDVSGDELAFPPRWSLVADDERTDDWRIGGSQHLAVHDATGRLYSLVHQGEAETQKHDGTELWVYDLAGRERLDPIELVNPGLTFMGVPLEFGRDWPWPFNRLYHNLLPNMGIGMIVVTQDAQPLLVTGAQFSGSVAVHDALSGAFLRRVFTGNLTAYGLSAPWGALGRGSRS
jgi:methylamine dehydrogenase heavy chain